MSIEAMKQALEALQRGRPQIVGVLVQQDQDAAITSLRQAIEQSEKQEPVAIHCKAKRENNGVCPNHNLQCGWPKCNEPPTFVRVISSKQLSAMFQDLKGIDTSQSGYHWRVGYNAALRQAMDYSMPFCTTPQPQQTEKQEPITYDKTEMNCFVQELYDRKMQEGKRGHYETMFHCVHQAIKRLYTTTQLQQGEKSEPLDKVYICNSCGHAYQIQPPSQCDCLGDEKYTEGYIYTTPQPQREWVGLTDAEQDVAYQLAEFDFDAAYKFIEAKIKERNHVS